MIPLVRPHGQADRLAVDLGEIQMDLVRFFNDASSRNLLDLRVSSFCVVALELLAQVEMHLED